MKSKILKVFSFLLILHIINSKFIFNSIYGWLFEPENSTEESLALLFQSYRNKSIGGVNYLIDKDLNKTKRAARIAKQAGLQFFVWAPVLLADEHARPEFYKKYPNEYVVNRNNQSTHEHYISVPHYKFLDPSSDIVKQYLVEYYTKISKIEEIDGVNLDYIRFIEQYGDGIYAEGDTCYCQRCIKQFANLKKEDYFLLYSDFNALMLRQDWKDFRVNLITSLVDLLKEAIHKQGKVVSADVYPGPELSTWKTRQAWDKWPIDAVFPMLYYKIFGFPIEWIGQRTIEANLKLNYSVSLIPGLYVNDMSTQEFNQSLNLLTENNAYGVSIFRLDQIGEDLFEVLKSFLKENSWFEVYSNKTCKNKYLVYNQSLIKNNLKYTNKLVEFDCFSYSKYIESLTNIFSLLIILILFIL